MSSMMVGPPRSASYCLIYPRISLCSYPHVRNGSQPRARSAKKRRIDDSDDEGVEYVISSASKFTFHLILVMSHTSLRLPPPTEAKISLPGKAPEGCVMQESR